MQENPPLENNNNNTEPAQSSEPANQDAHNLTAQSPSPSCPDTRMQLPVGVRPRDPGEPVGWCEGGPGPAGRLSHPGADTDSSSSMTQLEHGHNHNETKSVIDEKDVWLFVLQKLGQNIGKSQGECKLKGQEVEPFGSSAAQAHMYESVSLNVKNNNEDNTVGVDANLDNERKRDKTVIQTQGVMTREPDVLDVNSNITQTETPSAETATYHISTEQLPTLCPPGRSKVCDDEAFVPYILRNDNSENNGIQIPHTHEISTQPKETKSDKHLFAAPVPFKPMLQLSQGPWDSATPSSQAHVPIMTPLAMKTHAKCQNIRVPTEPHPSELDDASQLTGESNTAKTLTDQEGPDLSNINKTRHRTSADSQHGKTLRENEVGKTPVKVSAFRPAGSSGLTPQVGRLSLRGNITKCDVVVGSPRVVGQSKGLERPLLQAANERYHEALLNDEVERFALRLVADTVRLSYIGRCSDPVAKILMDGDEMHFIPVKEDRYFLAEEFHIEGSAFSRLATRAT